ncbi:MAG: DUF3859 domain-containing protein [Pseudomonadota bacterium]
MSLSAKRAITARRAPWAAGAFCFAVLSASGSESQEYHAERVSVLERGIFQAGSRGLPTVRSSLGPVTRVRDVSLIQSTTTIPARISMRIGLRYVITGTPIGASVEIRPVTRFPEMGLLDPISGVRHYRSEYIRSAIGAPAYREFLFDRSWEIVPGEWAFEFWQGGRNIGMQKFCVIDAESTSPQANCDFLIGRASWVPSDKVTREASGTSPHID